MKKYFSISLLAIFFITIFLLVVNSPFMPDPDTWFHVKSGELFIHHGLIFRDVFSFSAYGQPWMIHEWLFEVIIYVFSLVFGFGNIPFFVAGAILLQLVVIILISKRIFLLSAWKILCLLSFYLLTEFHFFVGRPQILFTLCLFIFIYILLLYLKENINLLWVCIPIALLWANINGSAVLAPAILIGYSLWYLFLSFIIKGKALSLQAKNLFVAGIATSVILFSPPLYGVAYLYTWFHIIYHSLSVQFIAEWLSITYYPTVAVEYIFISLPILFLWVFLLWKKKEWNSAIWLYPFLVFLAAPFLSVRNLLYAYITLVLLFAYLLKEIKPVWLNKKAIIFCGLILIYFGYLCSNFIFDWHLVNWWDPVNAVGFIQKNNLQGNMFNDPDIGGYLLYHLYPEQKVFVDGREDPYIKKVIPEFLTLIQEKDSPEGEYDNLLNSLFKKYNISYVVLETKPNTYLSKIAHILTNDNNWSLVFWDDNTEIFVRHDGKNDKTLKSFGVFAATPYEQSPFPKGEEDQALKEYIRMQHISDSSRTENAIGILLLKKGQVGKAKTAFEKAIQLDGLFSSPYANLGEIELQENNYKSAIAYYKKALEIDPARLYLYVRLGQLYKANGNNSDAVSIWQKGLSQSVSLSDQEVFQKLLSQIP